jgi:hypothetical protein
MRLWSLHPKYLDTRGLVAVWREALLAQAVLGGRTRGYLRHPQLIRFRESESPLSAIATYLWGIHEEACVRGHCFDAGRIDRGCYIGTIPVTKGQLLYEWAHLRAKLELRAPSWLDGIRGIRRPQHHPLFRVVEGPVAEWERMRNQSE